jgi:hypothetical protein
MGRTRLSFFCFLCIHVSNHTRCVYLYLYNIFVHMQLYLFAWGRHAKRRFFLFCMYTPLFNIYLSASIDKKKLFFFYVHALNKLVWEGGHTIAGLKNKCLCPHLLNFFHIFPPPLLCPPQQHNHHPQSECKCLINQ